VGDVVGLRAVHVAMGTVCSVAVVLYVVARRRALRHQVTIDL
jgi:hypothetical protein